MKKLRPYVWDMCIGTPDDRHSTPLDPRGDGSFRGPDGAALPLPPPEILTWRWEGADEEHFLYRFGQ